MNLDKVLAISGKPGLYLLKVQTRTGFVAESLIDGKKNHCWSKKQCEFVV